MLGHEIDSDFDPSGIVAGHEGFRPINGSICQRDAFSDRKISGRPVGPRTQIQCSALAQAARPDGYVLQGMAEHSFQGAF